MNDMIVSLKDAFIILRKDKWTLLLSFLPIFIGIAVYTFLGKWLYGDVLNWGTALIEDKVRGGWLSALAGVIVLLLSVIFWFMINWTFVMLVSLIASPFNDIISRRVEKITKGQVAPELSESFMIMFKRLGKTLINEIKKIILLLVLTILGFIVSFFLPPLGFIISALLFAINFIDYSWARHDLKLSLCIKNIKDSLIPYTISGAGFLVLVSIPVLNLFLLPYSTIYYTILFTKGQKVLSNS
jgi:CysZ protein